MPIDSVLLDTTVQIWRIAHGPEESDRFHRELIERDVCTTSFVFREFLNTIIADIKYVHLQASAFLAPDENGHLGLERLARFLATGRGNYSHRSARRIFLVIGKLLESFERTNVPKGKILIRLERTARRWIRDFFRYPGDNREYRPIVCLTGLDDHPDDLEELQRGDPFPPKPSFPKAVAEFLDNAKHHVGRIENEMRKETKARGRDDKLLKVLGWLKADDGSFAIAEKLQTYKVWNWALGDMLIALETPEGVAIYSTDRAFEILCRALDKPRYLGYRAPA